MLKAYQRRNIQNFPLEVNPLSCTFAIVTDGCLPSLQQQPGVIGESHTHLSPSLLCFPRPRCHRPLTTPSLHRSRPRRASWRRRTAQEKNHSENGSIYTVLLTIIASMRFRYTMLNIFWKNESSETFPFYAQLVWHERAGDEQQFKK